MSAPTIIACPAGFFQNDTTTPATVGDLDSAVQAAIDNVNGALTSETNAAASATAAAASATAAAGSANAASTSATAASNASTNAAASLTSVTTQATNAAASASSASNSASSASTSQTAAAGSASNAATSATAAANSATAAATSETNAAASATSAAASVSTLPATTGNALKMVRVTSAANAYEARTPVQVVGDLGLSRADVGRNRLHNSLFQIAQRGTGAFTANGAYTLDRWQMAFTLDTMSVTQAALSDADRTAIGDEEAQYGLQNVFVGNSGASAVDQVLQKIENVRKLAGKTVTVSFWAKANAGTPKLGVGMIQSFGTGGSPSGSVASTGQSVTLSTSWMQYTLSFTLAALTGKTLGTNGDHHTQLNFYYSSGTTNAATAGSPGVQSGTVTLWGVQLEVGSVATPLEKPDLQQDVAKCQRFFQTGTCEVAGYSVGSVTLAYYVMLPTLMRGSPTITLSNQAYTNANTATATSATATGFAFGVASTATGGVVGAANFTASADL